MDEQKDSGDNKNNKGQGSNLGLYITVFLFIASFIGVVIDASIRK